MRPAIPAPAATGRRKPGPTARRFRVSDTAIDFDDLFQGTQDFDLAACGDVVVRRRDGLASYQLAVVVDDAFQGVTRVVRGADLLASTPWQIDLQDGAGAAATYLRAPAAAGGTRRRQTIEVDAGGTTRSVASGQRAYNRPLRFCPRLHPPIWATAPIKDVWKWALAHWRPQALAGSSRGALSAAGDKQQIFAQKL